MTASTVFLPPPRAGRRAGIAATVAVHALLIFGWTMTRKAPSVAPEPPRTTVQWIRLAAPPAPTRRRDDAHPLPIHPRTAALPGAITLPPPATTAAPAAPDTSPSAATAQGQATDAPASPAPPAQPAQPAGKALLERARRDAGAVDRALRKENYPYIVAPLGQPARSACATASPPRPHGARHGRTGQQHGRRRPPHAHRHRRQHVLHDGTLTGNEHRHDREARQVAANELPRA